MECRLVEEYASLVDLEQFHQKEKTSYRQVD
jgi:hypothetical protein